MADLEIRYHARAGDQAKLRQVQYNGRRYAISIEPVYWECLEEAADALGIRLNQLVSILAKQDVGPNNLAARLRLFCLHRLRRLAQQANLRSDAVDIASLIDAVPTPCFAIKADGGIAYSNAPLSQMVNENPDDIIGQPSAKFFRLRFADTANVRMQYAQHQQLLLSGTVALMIPGRVSARRFVASQIPLPGDNQDLLLIFIK